MKAMEKVVVMHSVAERKGAIGDKEAVAGSQPPGYKGPLSMFIPAPLTVPLAMGRRTLHNARSLKGLTEWRQPKGTMDCFEISSDHYVAEPSGIDVRIEELG